MTMQRERQAPSPDGKAIQAYEDDPGPPTQTNVPVRHPIPDLDIPPLPTTIAGTMPSTDGDVPGTDVFRYWVAADALSRVSSTWGPLMPARTAWRPSVGPKLTAHLDDGVDLNAFYDRTGIRFFHKTVAGINVFSGESPDAVCHETGHAVLDALRPQLWNAASAEAAGLHEAFGDISALLSALRLESMRIMVLAETQGDLEASSRVSRMAEQLGWAMRQRRRDSADPDCLRNMANGFFYRDPVYLPPLAPASQLASEPHSFSRIFSGAFLKALAGIHYQQPVRDPDSLADAATIAGQLLVDAVRTAPVVSGYYAQVAGHMIAADQRRHNGAHGRALRSAFLRHGILSPQTAASLAETEAGRTFGMAEAMSAEEPDQQGELADVTVEGAGYGLAAPLTLSAPSQQQRFDLAAADPGGGSVQHPDPERVATAHLEDLLRQGRVAVPEEHLTDAAVVPRPESPRTRTHEIVPSETHDGLALVRRCFD
jgi:hypothetical protein